MSAKKPAKKATKAAKSARKSAKANTPAKAAKPAKAEKSANPATPAPEASEGVYIAPEAEAEAPAATPAKPAAKPAKAKRERSAKAPAAKSAKAKREVPPAFEMVPLPAHITTPGGAEIKATERAIIVSEGLREVIFDPLSAYYFDRTWTEADGEKLPEPIPAGSVAIRRGDILRIITPDLKDVINAIMSARAAALARKRAEKAKKEEPRHD